MTTNQVAYQNYLETQRSNMAREAETNRSNLVKEDETARSNRANERLTARGQNLKLTGDIIKGATGVMSSGIKTIAAI